MLLLLLVSYIKLLLNTNIEIQTYDSVTSNFVRAEDKAEEEVEPAKPKKQHKGLRCIKCWVLLCRDNDFDYVNGQLWIKTDELRKSKWEGLQTRGSWVCVFLSLFGAPNSWTWARTWHNKLCDNLFALREFLRTNRGGGTALRQILAACGVNGFSKAAT